MTMTAGTEVYNADTPPVTARGLLYNDEELEAALNGSVSDILHDASGKSELELMLAGIATTEFAQENLKKALEATPPLHNWRVGEALAEAYLSEHRDCIFPWPSSRDLRNLAASPAGADLVGFRKANNMAEMHHFAFGEVKTSSEGRYPPNTMSGRHGMVKQLEKLRDSKEAKDALFLYLGHRVKNTDWEALYRSAAIRYLNDSTDVTLFGVLVRDVEPKAEDLNRRSKELADGCPTKTVVELRALYFPNGCISNLSERAVKPIEGKNANN